MPIVFSVMQNDRWKTFGNRLRWARELGGFTQGYIAEKIGISQPSYSELETGVSKSSTYTAQLAKLLIVDPIWLATGEGEPASLIGGNSIQRKFDALSEENQNIVSKLIDQLSLGQ